MYLLINYLKNDKKLCEVSVLKVCIFSFSLSMLVHFFFLGFFLKLKQFKECALGDIECYDPLNPELFLCRPLLSFAAENLVVGE